MPYIKQELRDKYEPGIRSVIAGVDKLDDSYLDLYLMNSIKSIVTQTFWGPDWEHTACRDVAEQVRSQLPSNTWDGALNYIISEIVGRGMKPASGWRYHNLHRAHGIFNWAAAKFYKDWEPHSHDVQFYGNGFFRAYEVFLAAGAEFYRRVITPYEEQAIVKNGDIQSYQPT